LGATVVERPKGIAANDASGRVLGVISPAPPGDESSEVDEMKRRLQKPLRSYSTEEVLSHLRSLDTK
jgi:hypothetical protein